jgi:hypothetical protein
MAIFPWLPTILFVEIIYDTPRLLLTPVIYCRDPSSPPWGNLTSLVCPSITITQYSDIDIDYLAETYRYNETPVYTASNGCPVREDPLASGNVNFRSNVNLF